MTYNTELQRVMRIRRLGRQIAASLPADPGEQAFQVCTGMTTYRCEH